MAVQTHPSSVTPPALRLLRASWLESRNVLGLIFMLPAAALLLLFLTYPLGLGLWLGLTDQKIDGEGGFIGLGNFISRSALIHGSSDASLVRYTASPSLAPRKLAGKPQRPRPHLHVAGRGFAAPLPHLSARTWIMARPDGSEDRWRGRLHRPRQFHLPIGIDSWQFRRIPRPLHRQPFACSAQAGWKAATSSASSSCCRPRLCCSSSSLIRSDLDYGSA